LIADEGVPNFRLSSKLPIQSHRRLQLARRVEDIVVRSQFAESLALDCRRTRPKSHTIENIERFHAEIQVHFFSQPDFAI
jgi:hypothetical protein